MRNYSLSFFLFAALLLLSCAAVENKNVLPEISKSFKIDFLFEKEIKGTFYGATLLKPFGLAVDFEGNVYLADAGNNRLLKFDSDFKATRKIGGLGTTEGSFNYPTFITFDNGLNLMVSDEKNQRVARFNSQLQYVDELLFFDEEDPLKFGYPSGISFTNYGETWVVDRDNSQVVIFNNIGQYSHSLGDYGYSGGQLSSPEKIIRDRNGEFLVCDAGNKRIVRYDEYGSYLNEYGRDIFEYPVAIALHNERMVVLDAALGSLIYLSKNGQFLGESGSKLLGDKSQLSNPSDFIFLSNDMILIADTGNDRLVVGKLIIEE